MTTETGVESPHPINAMLIWQQPHPIFFAELDYRQQPTSSTLDKWRDVVFATADFMASYAHLNRRTGFYDLGPGMDIMSENTVASTATNPTFELSYWRFGLGIASQWRQRLGLSAEPLWDTVLQKLAPLPVHEGLYVSIEGQTDTYTKMNWEHPSMSGVFGCLPGDGVDLPTFERTLQKVREVWRFDHCWGWDFPMLAMACARVGDADGAIDALLMNGREDSDYKANGIYTASLPYAERVVIPYLSANGGLLYAAAMMAAGWTGSAGDAPGFPKDRKWRVRHENLSPAI